jgi:hypothetical protein
MVLNAILKKLNNYIIIIITTLTSNPWSLLFLKKMEKWFFSHANWFNVVDDSGAPPSPWPLLQRCHNFFWIYL